MNGKKLLQISFKRSKILLKFNEKILTEYLINARVTKTDNFKLFLVLFSIISRKINDEFVNFFIFIQIDI